MSSTLLKTLRNNLKLYKVLHNNGTHNKPIWLAHTSPYEE